jgi:hypothetical protein
MIIITAVLLFLLALFVVSVCFGFWAAGALEQLWENVARR